MSEVFTYDRFEIGASLGSVAIVLGDAFRELWSRIYPDDMMTADLLPLAAANVVLMRAFRAVVDPSPPGIVHAGQAVDFVAAPRLGETIDTHVRCIARDERNGRRFVTLATRSTGDERRVLFTGKTELLWTTA